MNTFRKNVLGILVFTLLLVMASCGEQKKKETVETEAKTLTLEQQMDEIMAMWPGTYNNDKQCAEAEAKGEAIWRLDDSGENGYLNVQSHYIKLDRPEIGKHVLYVEEYRDQQPDSIYRQRIYTISDIDSVIRVKMWPFKDKKKYVGAWKNPSMLDSLTTEEISAYPEICDLLVKQVDDKYNMKMNGKDCTFGTKTFNYEVMLSDGMFSYRDKITDKETDSVLTTAANYAFHDLNKIGE